MAFAGLLIVLAGVAVERRGYLARLGFPYADHAVAAETTAAKAADTSRRPAAKTRSARNQRIP